MEGGWIDANGVMGYDAGRVLYKMLCQTEMFGLDGLGRVAVLSRKQERHGMTLR